MCVVTPTTAMIIASAISAGGQVASAKLKKPDRNPITPLAPAPDTPLQPSGYEQFLARSALGGGGMPQENWLSGGY